jgi:hypothetical protein
MWSWPRAVCLAAGGWLVQADSQVKCQMWSRKLRIRRKTVSLCIPSLGLCAPADHLVEVVAHDGECLGVSS